MSSPALRAITAGIWSLGLYVSLFLTLGAGWKMMYGHRSLIDALKKNIFMIAILVLMVHPSLQDEFLNGQVNLFVMGATAGFLILLERNRLFGAALLLAIAASIKIAPGFALFYVLFSRQYKVALYFFPLAFLFCVGIPYMINEQSLEYYRYFVSVVMPTITGSDLEGGFRSFSIISTLSYLLNIHWYPPFKILATGVLAAGLLIPIVFYAREGFQDTGKLFRFTTFGAIVSVVPLTFPMSEAHHLLLQIIPFIAIIAYWRYLIENKESLLRDRLSLVFLLSGLGYHVGHGLKDTPIRLLSLIGVYCGLILLLKKHREKLS
jgi:hypothetical protein